MKRSISAVALLLALAGVLSAQAQSPAQNASADAAKAPDKAADVTVAVDQQVPSGLDPRVCLEFPTTAQVIACAEKYRPRKRHA